MAESNRSSLRQAVVRIILASADGDLTPADLDGTGGYLSAVGYSSLSYIRMLDSIENELGVYLDPDEQAATLETVDDITDAVAAALTGGAHV